MALKPTTITANFSAAKIGGVTSAATGVHIIVSELKSKAAKKIGAAVVPGLNWAMAAGLISSGILAAAGKNGLSVTLHLGVKTATKIQQGKKYTFETYYIKNVTTKVY